MGNATTSEAVAIRHHGAFSNAKVMLDVGRSPHMPATDDGRLLAFTLDSDVDRLKRLKALSWLSATELAALAAALDRSRFKRGEMVLRNDELNSRAHILLTGILRITCLNAHGKRATVALIAPGPIPEFPQMPISRSEFQCEAYTDCRIGSLSWEDFERIAARSSASVFKNFHQNDMKQWYRLLLRSSSYLNLDLHDRIAVTLLDLCADFGIEEARGTMLRVSFSHKVIASLVGASRPRVTEHLGKLERDHLVIRQGRQMIVRADQLAKSIGMRAA